MSCLPDVNACVYILIILFGMGSWVAVNGIWVELPILVDHAPEHWNLPSYITIIIQIANIGPILYTVINRLVPRTFHEKHGVFILVTLGAAGTLLLAFFWKETSYIGGVKHSTGLLFSVFLLSLVDCTSSVIFLPYMSIFKPQYISALYIGEGLSGLVPSLVALGQGVDKTICLNKTVNQTTNETIIVSEYLPPNFPVENFFFFLFSIMIICGLAFCLLHYLPYCKKEHVAVNADISAEVRDTDSKSTLALQDQTSSNISGEVRDTDSKSTLALQDQTSSNISGEVKDTDSESASELQDQTSSKLDDSSHYSLSNANTSTTISRKKYIFYLILIGFINALTNGILPAVSSYACMPYGTQPYHLSATLSNISNPLMCLVAFFLPVLPSSIIGGATLVGFSVGAYILVMAANSPTPPLADETAGAVLIILAFILVTAIMSFSKVSIATVLRLRGRKALLWCGMVTQIGSALGAILMFVLVNQMHLFHQKEACT